MIIVTVWDLRDRKSDEPESDLGEFNNMEDAISHVQQYLAGENGRSIYKIEIVDKRFT